MSQTPPSGMPQDYTSKPQKNILGTVGFYLSLLSVISCGMGSPVALVVSLIALRKKPKAMAIIGTVLSSIQILIWVIFGTALAGLIFKVGGELKIEAANTTSAHEAAMIIEDHRGADKNLPTDDAGTALIASNVDYWKTPLHYHQHGDTFDIISAGPDKQFGTADDVAFSEAKLITPTSAPTTAPGTMP